LLLTSFLFGKSVFFCFPGGGSKGDKGRSIFFMFVKKVLDSLACLFPLLPLLVLLVLEFLRAFLSRLLYVSSFEAVPYVCVKSLSIGYRPWTRY
jgi:hypothetical protein